MDLFQSASQWLSDVREASASQDVTINGVPFKATVSATNADTNLDGHKLQAQYTHFIIKKAALLAASITIDRGLNIIYNGRKYEIGYDKRLLFEPNDPAGIDLIISTVDKGPAT